VTLDARTASKGNVTGRLQRTRHAAQDWLDALEKIQADAALLCDDRADRDAGDVRVLRLLPGRYLVSVLAPLASHYGQSAMMLLSSGVAPSSARRSAASSPDIVGRKRDDSGRAASLFRIGAAACVHSDGAWSSSAALCVGCGSMARQQRKIPDRRDQPTRYRTFVPA